MFVLTPVSAIHSGYPSCPTYNCGRAAEAAVQCAAYDYAVAHARAEAIRQQRAEEERRYRETVRHEQARRRAQAVEFLEALYEQEHPVYFEESYPLIDAERYRRGLELDAARRRTELIQQRQQAERARAAAIARQHVAAERRREAQRREQEHWIRLLTAQFDDAQISQPKTEPVSAPSTSRNLQPEPHHVSSELKRRLQEEEDEEISEALQHLLYQLDGSAFAPVTKKPKVDKGKARETPAIPFNLPKSKPETPTASSAPKSFNIHISTPSSAPAKPEIVPTDQGADLHRTPAMTPAQAQEAKERLEAAQALTLSLGAIKRIEDSLRALESSFVFPSDLDLARPASESGWDSDSETELAFTAKNKPVHVYEHALIGLLSKLDAVESFGDEEVRGRRKEVVNKVEKALRDVDRRVEESRERTRSAQEPLSEDAVEELIVKIPIQDVSEDKIEPEAEAAVDTSAPVEAAVEAAADTIFAPVETVVDTTPAPVDIESTLTTEAALEPASAPADDTTSAAIQALIDEVTSAAEDPIVEPTLVDSISEVLTEDATPESVVDSAPTLVTLEPVEASMDVDTPAPASDAPTEPTSVASEAPAEVEPSPYSDAAPASDAVLDTTPVTNNTESSTSVTPSIVEQPTSPTPSDDTFLFQSNPIPDPAPYKASETTAADKADEDLDIIESDEAAEVLNELNDAEWSDVEAAH